MSVNLFLHKAHKAYYKSQMPDTDLDKKTLYEGVKLLLDQKDNHIHLSQQKLYTLFSISFQYMLFLSTKDPGHYVLRVEDSYLLNKLQKKAKDLSTRRFLQTLALPRKLVYGKSTFILDFFNLSTWSLVNDIPKEKFKGALVVKNAHKRPISTESLDDDETHQILSELPDDYYYRSLLEFIPKSIIIAFDEVFENIPQVSFPFIKEAPKEKVVSGVKIASDIDLDNLE